MPAVTEPGTWRPVPGPGEPDQEWEAPALAGDAAFDAGPAYTVEFRTDTRPCSAVTAYVYPAWPAADPGLIKVHVTLERVAGDDPADPVATETWSDSVAYEVPSPCLTLTYGAASARYLALLLAEPAWPALDEAAPGLRAVLEEWDGEPYDRQPAAAAAS